jgi:regulator of sigma E protease
VSVPSLGIAYDVLNVVHDVLPDSPSAGQGIRAGDEIVEARFVASPEDAPEQAAQLADVDAINFDAEHPNWPAFVEQLQGIDFFSQLQGIVPGTSVRLTVRRGDETRDVELTPVDAEGWFNPLRGLQTTPVQEIRKAESVSEALVLGLRETKESLLIVFRFLKKLIDREISPRLLGGPVTIAKVAGESAFAGLATLLIFLTVLSANLAVLNFLPIPLLDGGHMVLLLLEGILRRPVSERFVIALHTIGFVFIVSLMLFVIALDVGLIPRPRNL